VRRALEVGAAENMRVRLLAGGRAVVELDYEEGRGGGGRGGGGGGGQAEWIEEWIEGRRSSLRAAGVGELLLGDLGFSEWDVRRFKSGGEAREIKLPDEFKKEFEIGEA